MLGIAGDLLIELQFTGSYSYSGFRSCIAINPWDTRGTAKAIHQALTMGDEEALSRWEVRSWWQLSTYHHIDYSSTRTYTITS